MASFNRVLLMGNFTRDPQMKYLPSQTPVVEFGLATNRRFKAASGEMRDETTFVDCAAFGRQAEVINQYCTKGKPILIEGRLKFDSWDDKNGGGKRSKLSVVVENFQLLGGRSDGGGGAPGGAVGGASAGGAGTGGGEYDAGDDGSGPPRSAPPQRSAPPPNRARPAAAPPPQQPFGDEQQFNDDDIPL